MERMSNPTPYMLLANEMGTGKTKTFLAALQMRMDRLAAQVGYKKFKPTLCISPVATITQTVQECLDNFPNLQPWVFYSTQSGFPIKSGVKVFTQEQLADKLKALRSKKAMKDVEVSVLKAFPICY